MDTPQFKTQSVRRINGSIADWIGSSIVRGEIAPGDTIAGEIAFRDSARVSRSAYREAVRTVASKGLLFSRPRIGTQVAPREKWNLLDPDVVRWFFEAEPPPEYFVQSLYELRQIVEPQAAALAAVRRTDRDLAEMAAALDAMERLSMRAPQWQEADADFHRALLRASGNDVLMSLASGICAAVSYTTAYKYRNLIEPRNPIEEHRAVGTLVEKRDAEGARKAMSDLVDIALRETSNVAASKTRSFPEKSA